MIANVVLTLLFGVLVTVHVSMNARIGTIAGSAVAANAAFWLIGGATSVLIAAANAATLSIGPLLKVPPALFLAGVLGCCLALFNTWVIPRIGIAAFSLLIILGQLSASAFLARTGFLGSVIEPMPAARIAGLCLVALGTGLFVFVK